MHVSHADEDVPRITTSERHKRAFLLRIRFTGETATPAQHLHTMVKLYTLPLDQSISEALK